MSSTASRVISDEIVATRPLPGVANPSNISFSPCGNFLTFLQPTSKDNLLSRELYYLDLKDFKNGKLDALSPKKVFNSSGMEKNDEDTLSLDDKLRRERSREMSTGVTDYNWSSSGKNLIIPIGGNIFAKETASIGQDYSVFTIFNKNNVSRGEEKGGIIDPNFCSDGNIVFVWDRELYIIDIDSSKIPYRLTHDARNKANVTNGLANFLAQEEMNRYKGYWISPDSEYIAYEQGDESHIPCYRIMHQGKDIVGEGAEEDHRYSFPGAANPKVKLGVISLKDYKSGINETLWLDIDIPDVSSDNTYLARVNWLPDRSLAVEIENREQNKLYLYRYDVETGCKTLLLKEESDSWINLHDLFVSFESTIGEQALNVASLHASDDNAMDTSSTEENNKTGFFFHLGK